MSNPNSIRSFSAHAFSTWMLAHCIHVGILIFGGMFVYGELFELSGVIAILGLLASIPAIAAFWTAISVIIKTSLSPGIKLFLWLIIASGIVGVNAYLLMFGLTAGNNAEALYVFIALGSPSVIAIFLAVLIRGQQFLALNEYFMSKKTKEDSNTDFQNQPI